MTVGTDTKWVSIYGLVDPVTHQLKYVGKTTGRIRQRFLAHINDVKRGRTYIPRHKWIAGLLAIGALPEIFEIETVPAEQWTEAEQFWIAYFRSIGCELLNATAGGDGLVSYKHRPETRAKQSASGIARFKRPGERERNGVAVRAGLSTPEAKQHLRDARKKVSRESIQIGLDALIKHAKSPEGRALTSARFTGRKISDEAKRKISTANTGRCWDDDRKERFSEFRRGRKHSADTKAKIAAAQSPQDRTKTMRGVWADPEYRAKQAKVGRREMLLALWSDPKKRAERMAQQAAARTNVGRPL